MIYYSTCFASQQTMTNGVLWTVPILPHPTPLPIANDQDPPFTFRVQQREWKERTCKPASFLVTISLYLQTFSDTKKVLRYCKGSHKSHSKRIICFPPSTMNHLQLKTLIALLDGTLKFSWENGERFMVFS